MTLFLQYELELKAKLTAIAQIEFPIVITGPAHSGKQFFAQFYFKRAGLATFIPIRISPETTAAYLYGQISCTDTPGRFSFKNGVLATALINGSAVLVEVGKQDEKSCFSVLNSLLVALEHGECRVDVDGRSFPISAAFRIAILCDEDDAFLSSPFCSYARIFRTIAFDEAKLSAVLELNMGDGVEVQPAFLIELGKELSIPVHDLVKIARRLRNRQFSKFFEANNAVKLLDYHTKIMLAEEIYSCFAAEFERQRQESLLQEMGKYFEMQHNILQEKIFAQQLSIVIDPISAVVDVGRFQCVRFEKDDFTFAQLESFAETHFTKRLIQEIVGCVVNNENMLLISSTGVGKTYTLEAASKMLGNCLDVINFSGQTDVTDLIGGYKPVSQKNLAKDMYNQILELVKLVLDTDNPKNEDFVHKLYEAFAAAQYEEFGRLAMQFVKLTQRERLQSLDQRGHELIRLISLSERELVKFKDCQFFFKYQEGVLIKALEEGHFVLFDEINLAPVEVLECIGQVLQNECLAVSEAADGEVVKKHENFRVFASMNPASTQGSAGRRELPEELLKHFTKIHIYEMDERQDVQELVRSYVGSIMGDAVEDVVDCFFALKALEKTRLTTATDMAPVYSIRTLCRALNFVKMHYAAVSISNALFEGFELYFASNLNSESRKLVLDTLCSELKVKQLKLLEFRPSLARLPFLKQNELAHVVDQIYFPLGSTRSRDFDLKKPLVDEQADFVITQENRLYLHEVLKALLSHESILLEGVTSAGKSSLVIFLAKLLDYRVFRINNHENTDISDYFGTFEPDAATGQLEFSYGPLIRAMQSGAWLILDELNLCNSEILEALNRLLDDNGEVFVPETGEIFKPAPGFAVFATQNPAGIVAGQIYGGRKQLSDAFKNRFVCFEMNEIGNEELEFILEHRRQSANLPARFTRMLVDVCAELRTRLAKVMAQGSELESQNITLRDVFRVADRLPNTIEQLALEMHMVLAERQRSYEMRQLVDEVIARLLKTPIDERIVAEYYEEYCAPVRRLIAADAIVQQVFGKIVFTADFQRLFALLSRAMAFRETPLLVGAPGAGKTQAAELAATMINSRLTMINLHKNTDVSDFIGQMRPIRNRVLLDAQLRDTDSATGDLYTKMHEILSKKVSHIFHWYDGALLDVMIRGGVLLLDEINLAPDAILERLNSVFETQREITVPEKPMQNDGACAFLANPKFFVIATMNPGNDHGKRELSPALRNRMTEIYVNGITDVEEVGLILSQRATIPGLVKLCQNAFCAIRQAETNFEAGTLNFTIRDIIAVFDHCNFVFSGAEPTVSQFFEELRLCYLDGLQVRLCTEDAQWVESIFDFIKQLLVDDGVPATRPDISFNNIGTGLVFSSDEQSFTIENVKDVAQLNSERFYDLGARTVASNAFRLAKALASPIDKAILVESSPGAGKTSIVEMLAQLTGHGFTRINLSENVDLQDLVGQDLPTENGGFQFVEGALTRALQTEDEWILFDELNLASQAVLEGLNGLFDHRKTLFIPELNKSVSAARGVRLFAAENPAWEGSGRKQLPQSFLNRFLCLWFEDLCDSDYESVLARLLPCLEDAQRVLLCLLRLLQHAVNRSFGHAGGIWELNLRDVFRVYDFVFGDFALPQLRRACSEVFMLRFREESDLERVEEYIEEAFGVSDPFPYPVIRDSGNGLYLGRFPVSAAAGVLVSDLPMIHAILGAFRAETPVLLVYRQDALLVDRIANEIAQLLAQPLCAAPLSASTDVSDIFGCYEQYSARDAFLELIRCDSAFGDGITLSDDDQEFSAELDGILARADKIGLSQEKISAIREIELHFAQGIQKFVWKDGVVTRAVEEGLMLYLQNVNFCTAAVLDRLNSLLERNAEFYLYEQGSVVPRKLRVHKNFRVLLAYQEGKKDISRAVRNRCFEVCVDSAAKFSSLVYGSTRIDEEFDNIRESRFATTSFDPQCELMYRCYELRNQLDCDNSQALRFLEEVLASETSPATTESQLALLREPDTQHHSEYFSNMAQLTEPCTRRFEVFCRWIISYEYQSDVWALSEQNMFPKYIIVGNYQFEHGLAAPELQQKVVLTILQAVQLGWILDGVSVLAEPLAHILLLADTRHQISEAAALYHQLEYASTVLETAAFADFVFRVAQDEAISKTERYILQLFARDMRSEATKLADFRKSCKLDALIVTEQRIQQIEKYFSDLKFDFMSGRAKYKNESVLLTLCGRDELFRFSPQTGNLIGQMATAVMEEVAFSNETNKSVLNLLDSPLMRLVKFVEHYQYSALTYEHNQERVVQQFNLLQHNTKAVVEDLPIRLAKLENVIKQVAQTVGISVHESTSQELHPRDNLQILGELYVLANFSQVFDVAVLNQYDKEYFAAALSIVTESKPLFEQHEAVTQARSFEHETKFGAEFNAIQEFLEENYNECVIRPARCHCDEEFYQELEDRLQTVDISFLRNMQQCDDQMLVVFAEEFGQQLKTFYEFLGAQPMQIIVSYADYLLPVLFILTATKTQFDIFRYELRRHVSNSDVLLQFVFNATNSYISSRYLLPNAEEQLSLYLEHVLLTDARISGQEIVYIAAEFKDYDFDAFQRLLYEQSPFRSKRYTREATFEEGLIAELKDLFPGYDVQDSNTAVETPATEFPVEIDLIVQFGHLLLRERSTKYYPDVTDDYMTRIADLLAKHNTPTAESLLLVLQAFEHRFEANERLYGRESTVLAQLRSHTERRRVTCRNIYKTAYPSEVVSALGSVKQKFAQELNKIALELPDDPRINAITSKFGELQTMDLQTPLVFFMRSFEQLLDQMNQYNHSSPFKFSNELIGALKASIIYFRRIELASWNSFFDDIDREQIALALLSWPQLLIGGVGCCEDPVQVQEFAQSVETYLQNSSLGQLHCKLDVLSMIQQALLFCPNNAVANSVLEAMQGRYRLFDQFVAKYVEEQSEMLRKQFEDQVKLFQWEEADFKDFQMRIRKSHCTILSIVRKYSELAQEDVHTLREQYLSEFLGEKEVSTASEKIGSALSLLSALQSSKDKLNFMEMEAKTSLEMLRDALEVRQHSHEFDAESAIMLFAENAFVMKELEEDESINMNIIAALAAFSSIETHKSIGRHLLALCKTVILGASESIVFCQREQVLSKSITENREPGDRLIESEKDSARRQYMLFYKTMLRILGNVLERSPEFAALQSATDATKTYDTARLTELHAGFTMLIEMYEHKYGNQPFEKLRQFENDLFENVGKTEAYSTAKFIVLPFAAEPTPGDINGVELQDLVASIEQVARFLAKGFPEKPKEQETRKGKQLDGTGLGDEEGENDINSQVEEEELSEDELLGNDAERPKSQELSENDNGIEMDRDFAGEDESIEEGEEEEEEQDVERELGSEDISNKEDQRERSMNENSEELEEKSDQETTTKEQQLAEKDETEEEAESGEQHQSDVSEQIAEYEEPDDAEQFEEASNPSEPSNDTEEPEEESENSSFTGVLEDIFKEELEQPDAEELAEDEMQEIMQPENPLEQIEENQEAEEEQEEPELETNADEHNQDENEDKLENEKGFGAGEDEQSDEENNDLGTNADAQRDGENGNSEKERSEDEPAEQKAVLDKRKLVQNEEEIPSEISDEGKDNVSEIDENTVKAMPQNNAEPAVVPDENAEAIIEQENNEDHNDPENVRQEAVPQEEEPNQVQNAEESDAIEVALEPSQKTHTQVRALSERLVMLLAPTETSELCGDFRSGKRLNLRKIVPFVASNFRRDKIWLRRERPQKRVYNLIICVDDSRSVSSEKLSEELIDCVLVLSGAARSAELGDVTIISFAENVELLFGPSDAASATFGRVGAALQKLHFKGEKTDFVGLFKFIADAQGSWNANNTGKTLVLVLTDGMIGEREGLQEYIEKVQESAIVLFCIHNTAICDKVQIVFETDAQGVRKPKKHKYLEKFPSRSYVVVREGFIAEDLGEAVAQYLAGMLE